MKTKKLGQKTTVYHGEIISTVEWSHQIPDIYLDKTGASGFVHGTGCSVEDFNKMKPGQIMIIAKSGQINGIAKDSENRYRFLKTPTQE